MKKALGSFYPAVLLLMPAAFGQAPAPAPPEPGITIHQTVQEVVLEVMVRDARGRVVKNLKPSDLEVYEDGVRQQVQSFKFIEGREVMSQTSKASAPVKRQAAAAIANPLKAVNLVCIVFTNLDAYNKKFAVDAVREFLNSQLDADTWVAVFDLQSTLSVLHPFTNNRTEIMEAANSAATGTGVDFASIASSVLSAAPLLEYIEVTQSGNMASGGTVTATQKVSGGGLNPTTIVGADVSNSRAANIQRGDLAAQRREFGGIEGMREMEQIMAMIRQLGTLPGRKSVLLLSPGLATTGDPDLFKSMVDKANKANVTVYGIDVNGLSAEIDQSQASSGALKHAASVSSSQGNRTSSNSAAANMERMRQGDYVDDAVRTTDTQASLRALSESTGGFLIGSTNDLRKPFQRLVEDVETHYEVIYRPSSDHYDGRLRNINVKTLRADLNVESRKGYFALPVLGTSADLTAVEVAGLGALSLKEPPHAFAFKAGAYQFRPSAANSQNAVVFEIPAANLGATAEPGMHLHRMHVALLTLVKDANGQVVDKFSEDSPYEIPDENLTKAQATSIMFTHALSLPPGHYSVETAVLDREANRASTATVAFDSPEQKGVGLSSVMLVQHMEPVKGKVEQTDPLEFQPDPNQGQRVVPELGTDLASNVSPYVFFVVYPDRSLSDKPKIQVEFLVEGKLLAKQAADLPAPDATGAIPMVINTAAKPGNCELRVTALQGGSSAKQSLTYTIAAK
jgi:VWFA-related protein